MRRLSLGILVFCLLSGAVTWVVLRDRLQSPVPTVAVAQLVRSDAGVPRTAADGKRMQLVDVRSEEEMAVSMIPGAITRAEYERNPARYAGTRIVPYCTVGYRSRQYAETLRTQGVDVANFDGSILAWVRAGQPLLTPAGEPTRRVHTWSADNSVPESYVQVY